MWSSSSATRSALPSMAKLVSLYFGILVAGSTSVCGIQVSPNSPCASVCTNDPSDPTAFSTSGSEIVCKNSDYTFTPVGQKFETCLNCLQNSSAVDSGENDQAWFLYNLRFAFNTCIFAMANATDPITTPCSLDTVCAPIQGAMLDGMDDPETLQEYSYCSAYDNSFLGSFLGICGTCLAESAEESYFSNFLIALHGGCLQQPRPGDLIGLNSTVFTTDQVQITSPVLSRPKAHKVMTTGAIIGTAIAGFVVLLAASAMLFVCARKRRNASKLKRLNSPLDSRFGALNISAPTRGGFSSRRHSPPLWKDEGLPMKRTPQPLNFSRHTRGKPKAEDVHGHGEQAPLTARPSPEHSSASPPDSGRSAMIPTHAAYIPHEYTPPSRNSFLPHGPPSRNTRRTDSASCSVSGEVRHSALAPNARQSPTPDIPPARPPSAALAHRPMSTIPSASLVHTHAEPIEPGLARQPSSASRFTRFHAGDATAALRGRTRDASRGRRARDTSVDSGESDAAPVTISGPMVHVGSRFETDAGETLVTRGLDGTIAHHPGSKEMDESNSPLSVRSAQSQELWPGNY